ncbi:hypothetical protein TRFO_35228 [Tritrichomonas foetus]|uniref:GPR1/FUN34/yaaH family protein n=1 Tax=Tritrichomonas foetus TaxID=1144522 RepID=A0A1J4JMC3_9EUKA|nr:hypothetical protein TRFO_35228 [Tritrichomonas foetus]|eukprot:OHS98404.1 hypothetical protein TRFO_35228 [Tritrichomonas foetus]
MSLHDVNLDASDPPEEKELKIKEFPDKYGNTAPLGLLGFGMTTILLSFANVSLYPVNSAVIGMGIFYGGIAQFFSGIFEFKKGHSFTGTAFMSYGSFWLALVGIWTFPTIIKCEPADHKCVGIFLLFWGIFTFGMFFGTLKAHLTIKIIFGTLFLTFLLLSIGDFAQQPIVTKVGGGVGLLCGTTALYTGLAEVIDGELGYTLIPV